MPAAIRTHTGTLIVLAAVTIRCAAPAARTAGPFGVNPDEVTAVALDYTWTGYADPPILRHQVVVERTEDGWARRIVTWESEMPAALLESLDRDAVSTWIAAVVRAVDKAVPVMGYFSCMSHTDDYPELEAMIHLRSRNPLKVKSTSNCENMSPWFATDGEQLFTVPARDLPDALFPLLGVDGSPGMLESPEAELDLRQEPVTFAVLFDALVAGLDRALVQRTESLSDSSPLVSALSWMDHERFKGRLMELIDSDLTPPEVRAHAERLVSD